MQLRRIHIQQLLDSGELESDEVEKIRYLWPAGKLAGTSAPQLVRILSPFDPLVWDRRRFELFWGWPYRFEAYTPEHLRVRGYYAMPVLWGEQIIGWANATLKQGALDIKLGFVGPRPQSAEFRGLLEEEIERFRFFLKAS